jgi:hypothetical protein
MIGCQISSEMLQFTVVNKAKTVSSPQHPITKFYNQGLTLYPIPLYNRLGLLNSLSASSVSAAPFKMAA